MVGSRSATQRQRPSGASTDARLQAFSLCSHTARRTTLWSVFPTLQGANGSWSESFMLSEKKSSVYRLLSDVCVEPPAKTQNAQNVCISVSKHRGIHGDTIWFHRSLSRTKSQQETTSCGRLS